MQYSTDNVGFTYKTYGETLYCIDFPTISINFIRICGDFPVNSKVIRCNAYLFFSMQYLLVYLKFSLWGFQTMCNPHHNYMHITGYPVWHGDSLHFLWGKHLQCIFSALTSVWCFEQRSPTIRQWRFSAAKWKFVRQQNLRWDKKFPKNLFPVGMRKDIHLYRYLGSLDQLYYTNIWPVQVIAR